jgi:putative MATE family efflux protein
MVRGAKPLGREQNKGMAQDPTINETAAAPAAPSKRERRKKRRALSEFVDDPGQDGKRVAGFDPVLVSRIVRLGVPVIIGMATQTAINIIDSVMVGRLPDAMAVAGTAALGPSQVLLWFFGGFLSAIAVGTQAMTARRYGEGDRLAAGKVLTNSALLALGSSLVATFVALSIITPVFHALTPDPTVREVGIDYCRIRYFGLLGMVGMVSFKSFYDGVGRVRVHMTIAFVMNAVNFVLNYVLIFGFHRFGLQIDPLYVSGAAWGSVLSSYLGLILIILWSLRKRDRRRFRVFRMANISPQVAGGIARLSFWSGLATMFVMTGFALFYVIVGKVDELSGLPGINTSATSVIISITMMVFMTCLAFGTSTATLVSQSLGAGNPSLATRYGWQSVKLMVLAMAAVGLYMVISPESLLRLFLPGELAGQTLLKDQVIAVAAPSLRLCGCIAPIAAAALVLTQALYGAGESRFVMLVELVLHFTCMAPLAYFFAIVMEQGLFGCWMATGVYGSLLAVAMGVKFWRGSWTKTVI